MNVRKKRCALPVGAHAAAPHTLSLMECAAAFPNISPQAREALQKARDELQHATDLRRHCERLEQLRDDVTKRRGDIAAEQRYLTDGMQVRLTRTLRRDDGGLTLRDNSLFRCFLRRLQPQQQEARGGS